MPDIFNSKPGFVSIFSPDQAGEVLPGKIVFQDHENEAFVMAGMDYDQETVQQFQLSMRDSIYIYVFGDGMGKIALKGIIFVQTCGGQSGITEVMDLYNQYRASKNPEPVKVQITTFGNEDHQEPIQGYLTGFTIMTKGASSDPATLGMYDFRMVINTLPGE